MNKRDLFFCLFILLVTGTAQAEAQYPDIAIPDDRILTGAFTQTQAMQGFDWPLVSAGHFVLLPSRGIKWNVETPFPSVVTITPEGLTQESNGTTNSLRTDNLPKLKEMYHLIQGVLEGNWQELSCYFTMTIAAEAGKWQARLVPIKDEPGFPYAAIIVSGRRFVERVEMHNKNGDTETVDFSGIQLDVAPEDFGTFFDSKG